MALPTPPSTKFYSFITSETSPVGQRHIPGGSFAFEKELGSGIASGLSFSFYNELIDPPPSPTFYSDVKAVIFRNSTEGVGITNMRFFNRFFRAMADRAILQHAVSGIWASNPIWPSGIHSQVPKQLGSTPNLFRQDGTFHLVGTDDTNVSQFIYLNMIISNNHPVGLFGSGIQQQFNFAVVYDFFDIPS